MSENSQDQNGPIFIVGVGRSGTTLIRLMLHSHPRIAIPYESHFITKYAADLHHYGDLAKGENLRNLVQDVLAEDLLTQWDHEFDLDRIVNGVEEPNINAVIRAIYSDYCNAKGKTRWGDKSDYLSHMNVINDIFPNSQFIHCIRDGRDVANSVMKLPWGPNDLIQAAEWWSYSVRLGRAMGSMLPAKRYLEVRYEDLVQNTAAELRRICEFLGEDYSDSMLDYYKSSSAAIPSGRKGQHQNVGSPPKASRVCAWKKEMSSVDVAIFDRYAAAQLAAVGYEVNTPRVGKLRLEARRARIFLSRLLKSFLSSD